jgi:hypothetical protein
MGDTEDELRTFSQQKFSLSQWFDSEKEIRAIKEERKKSSSVVDSKYKTH